jgi:hypothetical protein
MSQNGLKNLAQQQLKSMGALAAVAGISAFSRLQAEMAREEMKRRSELQALVELTGHTREEILAAFHGSSSDWETFFDLILRASLKKIGLLESELKSFKLDQS